MGLGIVVEAGGLIATLLKRKERPRVRITRAGEVWQIDGFRVLVQNAGLPTDVRITVEEPGRHGGWYPMRVRQRVLNRRPTDTHDVPQGREVEFELEVVNRAGYGSPKYRVTVVPTSGRKDHVIVPTVKAVGARHA